MKITDLQLFKKRDQKISMVTCYDYWSAAIIANTEIDCVLVGDSLAMVMHGHDSTVPATVDLMATHIKAVSKGAKEQLIIGDMPFLSYQKSLESTMQSVEKIMQSGAHAIKLEGEDHLNMIEPIVRSGVSVFGHLGLTPQSSHTLGGFKVQGKDKMSRQKIIEQAKRLEDKGCVALVLECVPRFLAKEITDMLSIPTIGIGAGPYVDGQVLVLQDMLGLTQGFKAKFLKQYLNGHQLIQQALETYHQEVKCGLYPSEQQSYCLDKVQEG